MTVTILDVLTAPTPKPFDRLDRELYAGVEGEGFTSSFTKGGVEYQVVFDIDPEGETMIQVFGDPDTEGGIPVAMFSVTESQGF